MWNTNKIIATAFFSLAVLFYLGYLYVKFMVENGNEKGFLGMSVISIIIALVFSLIYKGSSVDSQDILSVVVFAISILLAIYAYFQGQEELMLSGNILIAILITANLIFLD